MSRDWRIVVFIIFFSFLHSILYFWYSYADLENEKIKTQKKIEKHEGKIVLAVAVDLMTLMDDMVAGKMALLHTSFYQNWSA